MAVTAPWLTVVGIGEDGLAGLGAAARAAIAAADVVVGGERHLALAAGAHRPDAVKMTWQPTVKAAVSAIAAHRGRRVVVLASGDPMWYGVGARLARAFDAAELAIVPHPGAFSLAAARLGWSLADTTTLTLHGRPLELLAAALAPGERIIALSEDGHTPARVAALLAAGGWGPSRMTVLERLGGPAERRSEGVAEQWPNARHDDLNTIAVECIPGPGCAPLPCVPGLPDDAFVHDGQITKREIRALTVAALAPFPGQLLWDVGAGAGSVAIEWMRAHVRARAIAIERDSARRTNIARNAAMLGVPGLRIVDGEAPAAFAGLETPDAVFVGGGLASAGVIDGGWTALRSGGRIAANAVTVEGEAALVRACAERGGTLTRIAIARAEPLGARGAWRAAMPVTHWAAVKP